MKKIVYLHGLESPQGGEKVDFLATKCYVHAPALDYTRSDIFSFLIETVLTELSEKIPSFSMTVPVPDGSTIDLTLNLKNNTSKEEINSFFDEKTTKDDLYKIIGITYDPIVSSDVVGNSLSGIVDGLSTMCIDDNKLKLIIWFDNGWGYASRIIEAVTMLGSQFE